MNGASVPTETILFKCVIVNEHMCVCVGVHIRT